jgi:hexosaminidase
MAPLLRALPAVRRAATCLLLTLVATHASGAQSQQLPLLTPQPASVRISDVPSTRFAGIHVDLPTHAGRTLRESAARLTHRLGTLAARVRVAGRAAQAIPVRVHCPCAPGSGLALGSDESSTLRVTADRVDITARTEVGVLRAFSTLLQLVRTDSAGLALPDIAIDDRPRFPWRGLMIDVARHFQSIDALKRQIDAMELVKLNVLHLHLSDAEAYRLESRRFPRLHRTADTAFYTLAQMRELVGYAADRGIRVVPEVDVPGHSRALILAYPFLGSGPETPRRAAIDPTRESTYAFLAALVRELGTVFPDPYLHTGADEVNPAQWNANPAIQRFMRARRIADAHALQRYFTARMHRIVTAAGKTMIGWDEVQVPGVSRDVVVQAWTSSTSTARAATAGHRTIASAGYYLDWLTPAESLHRIDPTDARAFGLSATAFAERTGTRLEGVLSDRFLLDTTVRMAPLDTARVLGGEAAMWTELVTEEKLDATVWPRAAAVADRLWAPACASPAPLDERLDALSSRLELIGLQHRASPRRMRARLAPGRRDALEVLAETLEPVKYYAHNHAATRRTPPPQTFTELADALPPQSATATRFTRLAHAWAAGDRRVSVEVRATLTRWRDNHAAFVRESEGNAALAAAVPLSSDVARLAAAALVAMDHVDAGTQPDAAWRAEQAAVLARHTASAAASSNMIASFLRPQPAGDVLLAPLEGLRAILAMFVPHR